jgi:hypothetical protein
MGCDCYCERCHSKENEEFMEKCSNCGTIVWRCVKCGFLNLELTGDKYMEIKFRPKKLS